MVVPVEHYEVWQRAGNSWSRVQEGKTLPEALQRVVVLIATNSWDVIADEIRDEERREKKEDL